MFSDPFDVALGDLRDGRGSRQIVRRGALSEALVADVDSRVPAGSEAVAEVTLEPFLGGISVSGRVCSRWEGECRRCLSSLEGELVAEVKEIFRRGATEDEGNYPMGEDHLNLRELVLDALFAELPVMPLCRDDCRGICSRCGADLNVYSCDCGTVEVGAQWAELEQLLREAPWPSDDA